MVVERLRQYQLHSLLYTVIIIMSYNGPLKAFLWLKKQFIIISLQTLNLEFNTMLW